MLMLMMVNTTKKKQVLWDVTKKSLDKTGLSVEERSIEATKDPQAVSEAVVCQEEAETRLYH